MVVLVSKFGNILWYVCYLFYLLDIKKNLQTRTIKIPPKEQRGACYSGKEQVWATIPGAGPVKVVKCTPVFSKKKK